MKKLSVILMFLLFQLSVSQKITKEFLIGEWESETTTLHFHFDEKMKFHFKELSVDYKEPLDIIDYKFENGFFVVEAVYVENNWKSITKFVYKDEDTLVADVVSDSPGIVIYKRVKK